MTEWSPEQAELRRAVRRFVEKEIAPHRVALEFEGLPPYDILRSYYKTFGLDEAADERFDARAARNRGEQPKVDVPTATAGETLIPLIEMSRCSPGLVSAMGTSVGLTAGAILRAGTTEQQERWARDLLTLRTVGSWALTEPGSGSDAFGGMRSVARRDGDDYVLNGSKTFITNAPFADVMVVICLDGDAPADDTRRRRPLLTFVLDKGMPGLVQSRPLHKMGLGSSPTGELTFVDLRVSPDRVLEGRPRAEQGTERPARGTSDAKATFAAERASVAAMGLGIIERCLELCVEYARTREQFGRPIGEFQLIQLKLADMEIARHNVESQVLRFMAAVDSGERPGLAAASAMKLYAARSAAAVTQEAVQLFGGNGYMAEYGVEQLARDAKALQIYGGTDEMQVTQIAKALLSNR